MADNSENVLTDLFGHLSPDSREDVKLLALNYVLGLTGTEEGMKFVKDHPKLLEIVAKLTSYKLPDVQKDSYTFLLNASTSSPVAEKLLELEIYEDILPRILDKSCKYADRLAMLLSNLTRMDQGGKKCLKVIENSKEYSLEKLFEILCTDRYNENVDLDYLAAFLSNMSRLEPVRMVVLDSKSGLIQRLMPYINYPRSVVRRKGVVGILRNCCFEYGRC